MSRTVTVTGHGSATAVPDTAVVRVAAVHRAAGMAEALAGAESARAAVVAAARDAEVDLVVSSTDLSVWPAHDDQGRRAGFEARHALTITGGDLDVAGALVGQLADEVGDRLQVESVSLSVGDPPLTEAREAAYADARARGEHLAALADARLGKVKQVIEGAGAPVPRGGAEAQAMKADVGFAPGQTVLTSTVTVTWTLG